MRYLVMLALLLFVCGVAIADGGPAPLSAPVSVTVTSFGELQWGSGPQLDQVRLKGAGPSFDLYFDGSKSGTTAHGEPFWANANYEFDLTESIDNYAPSASVKLATALTGTGYTYGGPTTVGGFPAGVVHNDYAMVEAAYDMTKGVGAENLSCTMAISLTATATP
jgi:hypothetical protein